MELFSWFSVRSMPAVCFVSHAYADQDIVKGLVSRLPRRVSAYIFPPITVRPDQRVSDDLVEAILKCEGLIHVAGGRSAESVWVSFERDYALRAGKKVFSYEADTGRFKRDRSRPSNLGLFASHARSDKARVEQVISFMKEKRHFDAWTDDDIQIGSDFRSAIEDALVSRLSRGGYVVAFISKSSLRSDYVQKELAYAAERWPDQLLPALLEPIESTLLPPAAQLKQAIVLYREDSDAPGPNWNRVDDLIVRIYDLVWRNSRSKSAPPDR